MSCRHRQRRALGGAVETLRTRAGERAGGGAKRESTALTHPERSQRLVTHGRSCGGRTYDKSSHVPRHAQGEGSVGDHRSCNVEGEKRQRHHTSRAMDEPESAQRDAEEIREKSEVRPSVRRDLVDQRETGRPSYSVAERGRPESKAERVCGDEEQPRENVRSAPSPEEATAPD